MSTCLLTTAKVRCSFGSPDGLWTRYSSPRVKVTPSLFSSRWLGHVERLVLEDFGSLPVETVRGPIDAYQISRM
jgi:hypothetical protein